MRAKAKTDVGARLARLQGQVRGLATMIEQERDPADVLTLIASIRAALDGVGSIVLTQQVELALTQPQGQNALSEDEVAARAEGVRRALARFVS